MDESYDEGQFMSADKTPVVPSIPEFAPVGHVHLLNVVDEIGNALMPGWTGTEIFSPSVTVQTEDELQFRAMKITLADVSADPRPGRSEADVYKDLLRGQNEQAAPRRRRQAAVLKTRELLFHGALPWTAFGTDGRTYQNQDNALWAAEGIDQIFDTGCSLSVFADKITTQRETELKGVTAVVLVLQSDLTRLIEQLRSSSYQEIIGSIPRIPQPAPRHVDQPGRKAGELPRIKGLMWEIAATILEGGELRRGRGRPTALARLVQERLVSSGFKHTENTISKYLRPQLQDWEKSNPDK
jgi:hypothetical protein